MPMRRDPVQKTATLLAQLFALADEFAPHGRVTVGEIHSYPSSRNTVPGRVAFSLDLRHQTPLFAKMQDKAEDMVKKSSEPDAPATLKEVWHSPPVNFDGGCITAIRNAAQKTGYLCMDMISGAGHDSVYISQVAPTGMIFVPCKGGISHNESESAKQTDLAAGCDVLLHAVLQHAGIATNP